MVQGIYFVATFSLLVAVSSVVSTTENGTEQLVPIARLTTESSLNLEPIAGDDTEKLIRIAAPTSEVGDDSVPALTLTPTAEPEPEVSTTTTTSSPFASAPAPNLVSTTSTTPIPPVSTTDSSIEASEVKCDNQSDRIKFSRDPNACGKFFFACFKDIEKPSDLQDKSDKNVYKNLSARCNESLLFDQIQLECLPSSDVDCTEFKCPKPDILLSDTKNPRKFIHCIDSIAQRHECQPHGTIFNNETQTCVKPPVDPEPFSLYLLRLVVRFMNGTKHFMSPWIEVVKINGTDRHNKTTLKDNSSSTHSKTINVENFITNSTENDTIDYYNEDDEVEVFTQDTKFIVVYYAVMAGVAFTLIALFLLIAFILGKLFYKPVEDDEDIGEEFYRYNQNDKYLMTRL